MSNTPITQIQLKRGTTSQWTSGTALPLAEGELGYALDTGELRIGKSGGSSWATSNSVGSGNTGSTLTFSGPTGAVAFSPDGRTLTGSSIFTFNPNTGYSGYTGLAIITGGLKVLGPIDPVSLTLIPQATNPLAGQTGTLWYSNTFGLQIDNGNGSITVGGGASTVTGPTGAGGGSTGATGPTGPASTVTGPTGFSGVPTGGNTGFVLTKKSGTNYDTIWSAPSGGGSITSGFYQVNIPTTSTFGTTTDTTNFPSSIGTWSAPTSTTITLTFNSSYSSVTIPPYFGGYIGFWFNSTNYKLLNINGPTAISNPIVSLVRSGTNWVWTMTINGTTFASSGNNGTYGFFLVMNMLN